MNQTILQLHLNGLYGSTALYTKMKASQYNTFTISQSAFSRSFSSIFFGSSSPKLLKFEKSRFEKILNSAIRVDQAFNLTDQQRNEGVTIDHETCIIVRCYFTDCITKGEGGAIKYKIKDGDLSITRTLFYKCEASDNGGAIYYQAGKYQFMQVCIDHCKAGNAGQSFSLQPSEDFPDTINYTTVSVCAPSIFGSIQYNMHHTGGGGHYYNDNVTRGLCDRIGAAMSCFRTNVKHIHFTHVVSCKGAGVISLDFGREPTELKYCNIINNTHTQSQIFTFSHNTKIIECFIVNNKKPFTRPIMTGKKHPCEFIRCTYDALGIEQKNDIVFNDRRDYDGEQPSYSFENPALAICIPKKRNPIDLWTGFSPSYFLLVTFGILLTHISFIHPQLFLDLYYSIFFDRSSAARRKRARPLIN